MKFYSADESVALIENNVTICVSGSGGGVLEPDHLLEALERRFINSGHPRDLTFVHCAGIGDGKSKGLNRLVHPGMVKRNIGGHWGWSPRLGEMALAGEIEAYNLPQGVISCLFREIAAGRPGLITKIGLGTYADPRVDGGKLNERTPENLVELIQIGGEEYLLYKSFPIHVALLVGSIADEDGNISLENEACWLDVQAMAMAVYNSGGKVVVQVKKIVPSGSLDPRLVKIPAVLVDAVVEYPDHWQTYAAEYNAAYSGEKRIPVTSLPPMPLDARKIIARRAAMELSPNIVVNLGFGMPAGVASVAAEEGISDWMTFSVEQGPIGGVPADGAIFGVSTNPLAFFDMPNNFDFYHGGGLNLTVLSFAQFDSQGNVNVSLFNNRVAGCGGFIDISQSAKKVVFVGTFTAGGLQIRVKNRQLHILQEGRHRKLLAQVEHITFSGEYAARSGQDVMYITERAVFKLTANGLLLTEIAPGIDMEKEVLEQMEATPMIADDLKLMDTQIFATDKMQLKDLLQ